MQESTRRDAVWPYLALTLLWLGRGITNNLARAAGDLRDTVRPRPRAGPGAFAMLSAAATGAALMFLLDPERGNARRAQVRDRFSGELRRARGRAERVQRRLSAETYGLTQKVQHLGPRGEPAEDDAELVQKIQSELGREPALAGGRVKVDAVDGIVRLRGQLEHPSDIRRLERLVRSVNGVCDVENLVHLPGTPERSHA